MIKANCRQTMVRHRLPMILNLNPCFLRLVVKIHESYLQVGTTKKPRVRGL
jgi:hypothetical protein